MRGVFPNLRQTALCDMAPADRALAPPGKRPAFVQCRLSALQLVGELEPLLGEIQQDSRVLGRVGRFGQLLAARRVRTTFFRIAGHSANPCATLHSRKRRMVVVNKGRLRPNSRAKAMVGPPPLPMRTARAEVGHYRRRDRRRNEPDLFPCAMADAGTNT